jgi:hypothetical protein
MASNISKADLFALPIPAEHVTLRIANAAVVSGTFTASITTAHRLPSLQLHQCTRNKWTASTYSNIHRSDFSPSFNKRKLTSQLRMQKFSNGWGYSSVEFDTASTPISPTLALVAGAETKLATTLCDAARMVAQSYITHNLTTLMII